MDNFSLNGFSPHLLFYVFIQMFSPYDESNSSSEESFSVSGDGIFFEEE